MISALRRGSIEDRQLREWLTQGEPVGISAVSWIEFLCGPVDAADVALASRIVDEPVALLPGDAGLGLLRLVLPEAAVEEVRRNLFAKLPDAVPLFEEFLRAVPVEIHRPTSRDRKRARELADAKDVPILAAAIGAGARLLVTHNVRDFRSGEGVRVVRPRTLIEEARAWMGSFGR